MKHILILLAVICPILSMAQLTGTIMYEDKRNLHMHIPEERAELKDVIPEFRTEEMQLSFNGEEAVYKKYVDPNAPVDEDVDMSPNQSRRFRMRRGSSNHILYQNYQTYERVEQRDFFDKKFLIKGEPHTFAWKMMPETKDVGNYTAHKATFSDTTQTIVAWYVPEIPVPLGPSEYGQLPGLILHVDINDGERTITATDIKLAEVDESILVKPTKGKEMTQEEFRAMVKEKMEERGMRGGPGMHMRRRP